MMAALKTKPTRKGQLKNIVLQNLLNFSESSEEEQTFLSASDRPASIPVKQGDVSCCTQAGEKENALKTTTTLSNEEDPKSGGAVVTEKKTISVDRRQDVHSKTKARCADLQKRVGGSQAERKEKSMSAKPKAKTSLRPQNVTLADLGISCDFSESSDSGEEGRFGKGQPQKHKADLPLKVKERAKHNKKLVPATVLKLQAPGDDAGVEGEREELGGSSKLSEQSSAAGIEALHAADVYRRQTQSSTVSKPASSSDYKQPSDDAGIKVSQSIQKNVTETNSKSVKSALKKLATTEKPHERGMKNLQITDKEKEVNSDVKSVKCPAPLQLPDVSLIRSAHFGSSILALASPSEESLLPLSESTRLDCPENFSAAKQSFGHLLASHSSPRVFESSKGDSRNSSYEQLGIVRKAAVGSQMKCSHAPREEGQTSGMAEGAPDESGCETSESELQYVTCLATPDASSMYEAVDVSVQTSFKFGVCASSDDNHGAAVSPVSADRPEDDPGEEDSSTNGAVSAADNVRLSEHHKRPEDGAETRGHDQGSSKLAAKCVTPSDLKSMPTAVSTKTEERYAGGEELSDSSPGADTSKEANCLKTEEGAASCGESEEAADSMPPQTLEADSKAPADSNYFSDCVSCVNTTSGSPNTHRQLQTGDHGPLDSLPQELHSLKLSGSVSDQDDSTEQGQCKGGESITRARQKSAASETSMVPNSKPRRGCSEDNHTGAECRSSAVWRNRRQVDSSSEEDDDHLEAFFQKMRNPDQPAKKVAENDNLDDFIVDDSDVTDSEEVVSDSDNESVASLCTDFGTESLPRTRSARQEVSKLESMQDDYGLGDSRSDEEKNESCSFGDDGEEDDEFLGLKTPKSKIRPAFSRSQTPCEGSLTWYTPATSMKTRPPRRERPAVSTFSVSSTRVLGSASRREEVWATPMCPPRTGSTTKLKPLGFLRSLSSDVPDHLRDQEARSYIIHFKRKQEELSSRLFKLFNSTIFENQLPADLPVVWNKRLLKTSGLCKQKRVNDTYTATIELSTKVCDSPERVRDTVVHEMCHAAVWILNKAKEGHGPHWKFWAAKANRIHPEIPMIRRCHDYSINTKYIYRCVDCGYQLGRHSKSLDTEGKVCGHCRGRFQLLTSGRATSQTATPRTPNPFAVFVKENYGSVKRSGGGLPHKQVMEALSRQFAQTKVNFS